MSGAVFTTGDADNKTAETTMNSSDSSLGAPTVAPEYVGNRLE